MQRPTQAEPWHPGDWRLNQKPTLMSRWNQSLCPRWNHCWSHYCLGDSLPDELELELELEVEDAVVIEGT